MQLDIDINLDNYVTNNITPNINIVQTIFSLKPSMKLNIATFKLDIKENDIVYMYGKSGSGKTLIKNEIKHKYSSYDILDFEDILSTNNALIDDLPFDTSENMKILSLFGLGEVFNFIQPECNLSVGQRFRYKILKALLSPQKIILIDEFTNSLDRITAKSMCFNLQKILRTKYFKTVICFGVNDDIIEDLNPNILLKKSFIKTTDILYRDIIPNTEISFFKDIKIEHASRNDYNDIKHYHYINHNSPVTNTNNIFKMVLYGEMIGIILYSYPSFLSSGRNIVMENKYQYIKGEKHNNNLNKEVRVISRIILVPSFRGLGLAKKLINNTILIMKEQHQELKLIELISVMTNYNDFVKNSNMKYIEYENKHLQKTINIINSIGITINDDDDIITSKLNSNLKLKNKIEKIYIKTKSLFYSERSYSLINYIKDMLNRKNLQYYYYIY